MSDGPPIEDRRSTAGDLHNIIGAIHAMDTMDTRVAILEARMNSQDSRLSIIEVDIRETKAGVGQVLNVLSGHVQQENSDRIKMFVGIITGLLAVLGFVGTKAVEALLK